MTIDQPQRQRALDPRGCFIVQAPAGAGKTELLVQRFLTLLAHTRAPEEIVAITFTRKAAAEMRHRILSALRLAQQPMPEAVHAQHTWQLAQAALQQDQAKQWNLCSNPQRLRVLTIDAFCASLTRQMPLLSGFGAQPQTLENPNELYLSAARGLLTRLESKGPEAFAIGELLLHLDNRVEAVEALFVRMLARRDQWLPHLLAHQHYASSEAFRATLEANLQTIVQESLHNCYQNFPNESGTTLFELLHYASENVPHAFGKCKNLSALPQPELKNLDIWLTIADFLLTQKFTWRATVDVRTGFPPNNKAMKTRMLALLAEFSQYENFRKSLQTLKEAPPTHYLNTQWRIVDALITLLPTLVMELTVLFQEHGAVDFTEISLAALRALGDAESPTNLALFLDHQIQHILVDEFQDTSTTQFRLLEQITAGWQPNDGRTLFLVGDPMQSIYRFRQAEVGLFLKAQTSGIGAIPLESIQLQSNFRSTPALVDWINLHLQNAFPQTADITAGAVPFSASASAQDHDPLSAISVHAIAQDSTAAKIVSILQQESEKNPQHTIAILVRSRSHLLNIIPALKAANYDFSAVEIEPLLYHSAIQDLLALTKALLHLSDRVAWLAILRAPWCGLMLKDLHAIANKNTSQPLWGILQNYSAITGISTDAQQRLAHFTKALAHTLPQRGRHTLRDWVENTWRELGGPLCFTNTAEIAAVDNYFKLLSTEGQAGDLRDFEKFAEKIAQTYFTPRATADTRLQVMTMHKAKGLEFDSVIIPHLEAKTRAEDSQLLLWLDGAQKQKTHSFILAPIKSSQEDEDAIYRYVRNVEKEKAQHEVTRLLYVALTRAKKNLHLIAEFEVSPTEMDSQPATGFLSLLWPVFSTTDSLQKADIPLEEKPYSKKLLRRLTIPGSLARST